MSKKAQIESIGLILIIILIVLAIVFTLPLLLNNQDIVSLNQQYLQLKADSTISVLLSTNPKDCSSNLEQELSNCLLENKPNCFQDCQELNERINEILKSSLQNQDYQLSTDKITIANQTKSACLNKISSARHFIAGETPISLVLCEK